MGGEAGPDSSLRRFRIGAGAALVLLGSFGAFAVAALRGAISPPEMAGLYLAAIQAVVYLVASLMFAFGAIHSRGSARHGWTLFTAATLAAFVAIVLVIAGVFNPLLALSVSGYTLFLFIFLNGLGVAGLLLLLPLSLRHRNKARLLLDALILCGSFFVTIWLLGAGTVFAASPGDFATRVTNFGYPFLHALILTLVVLAIGRARDEIDPPRAWLFAGAVVAALATPLATYLALRGDPRAALVGTGAAMAGNFAQGLGALRARPEPEVTPRARETPSLWGQLFPFAPLVLALGVVAEEYAVQGALGGVPFWTSTLVVLLVIVRLILTLVENRALALELGKAAETKSEMLRFISHEIGNPLTPLALQVHTMSLASKLEAQGVMDRNLAIVSRSVHRLTTIARDVRDMARVDAGRLPLERRATDLVPELRAAFEAFRASAAARGLDARLALPPQPVWALVDAERFGQVIDNLLSNAMKFTPAGGRVSLTLETDASTDEARIAVADSGVGLTEEQQQVLFQAFGRIHPEKAPGMGLGLFISKGIVEGHGGRIWAESDGPGRGTRFGVALPLYEAPGAAPSGR